MKTNDPIQEVESIVRGVHDKAGKFTQPVLKRYPLIFAFLIIFSVAAILHGFDEFTNKIGLFEEQPLYLVLVGVVVLIFTGQLYKTLDKM